MTLREIMDAEDDFNLDITEDMEREFEPERNTTMAMTEAYNRDPRKSAMLAGKMTPGQTERPSCADALESAVSALSSAANELRGVTDRLCGAVPEDSASKLRGVADGHFGQVATSRADIEAITERILGDTARIRSQL